jgi:hypothetical protein
LRESLPSMKVPDSIYESSERPSSIYSTDGSVVAPSELEFGFDDEIVNSRVYRRMLTQAMQKHPARKIEVVEGDLIDFSDEMTIKAKLEEVNTHKVDLLEKELESRRDLISTKKKLKNAMDELNTLKRRISGEEQIYMQSPATPGLRNPVIW